MSLPDRYYEIGEKVLADIMAILPETENVPEVAARIIGEAIADEHANLISVIADIRMKSGVGGKPMLDELADAIAARIEAARAGEGA